MYQFRSLEGTESVPYIVDTSWRGAENLNGVIVMDISRISDVDDAQYSVTLYGSSDFNAEERATLCKVFAEVMESVLGSPKQLLETQYDYNRIANKYYGTPLPLSAGGDEVALVHRFENAYRAACDAAFVAVFGDLSFINEDIHFEIQAEAVSVDESGSDRDKKRTASGWPDAGAGR
jgi:hypothetical protein